HKSELASRSLEMLPKKQQAVQNQGNPQNPLILVRGLEPHVPIPLNILLMWTCDQSTRDHCRLRFSWYKILVVATFFSLILIFAVYIGRDRNTQFEEYKHRRTHC